MRDLFTEDAVWGGEKGGFGKHEGLDAVCAFFGAAKDILTLGVHWCLQPRIKMLSDTEAEGTWYLWQSQDKRQEAYDLLAPVYGWFTEGFDTADLVDAKTLLQELA